MKPLSSRTQFASTIATKTWKVPPSSIMVVPEKATELMTHEAYENTWKCGELIKLHFPYPPEDEKTKKEKS